jgi:predicted nucleotidyltransferase
MKKKLKNFLLFLIMLKYNNQKLEQIFKKHKIVFAYLFGSQASKKTGPLSDIDIAFILIKN